MVSDLYQQSRKGNAAELQNEIFLVKISSTRKITIKILYYFYQY